MRQNIATAGGQDQHPDLQHVHLQDADKDMPGVSHGLCDAEEGGSEEREGFSDCREQRERRERAAGGGLQR